MRVVYQRVSDAKVDVDGECVASIGRGCLLLVGIARDDDETTLTWMADKVAALRVFCDDEGRMNRSLVDIDGALLAVSQFTLLARTDKGKRPSFADAAAPEIAQPLFDRFVELLRERLEVVATGVFGASMQVSLVNDGPVTIVIDR